MPTSLSNNYVFDGFAVIWYSVLFGLAGRLRHPQSAISGKALASGLGLYFHALGGDLDSRITGTSQGQGTLKLKSHGGLDLQAWVDEGDLHLPRRINRFSTQALNRELYYWLAAILAADIPDREVVPLPPGVRHLLRGVQATERLLSTFPSLKERHRRLCAEELAQRRLAYADPNENVRSPALILETAIRFELGSGKPCQEASLNEMIAKARTGEPIESYSDWQGRTVPFLPVPLWSYRKPDAPKLRIPWFRRAKKPQSNQEATPQQVAQFDAKRTVEQSDGRAAIRDHFVYPEWNCFDRTYRVNWCRLMEQPPKGGYRAEMDAMFAGLVERVRKQYMLIQHEPQWNRFLESGDEIDIDTFVTRMGDRKGCGIQNSRFYRERTRQYRDISVAILMDASRSTQARLDNVRVIETAKQSLAVLAEVLNLAGDEFALYSFSSDSRLRVRCDRIKSFDDVYDDETQRNILEVKPQNYTRLGAPVRHVGATLALRKSRQKLLIILTDGKPHDPIDRYEGKYALEDTRRALIEQRAKGVECFGLTIDQEGPRYLKHLFGAGHYAVYSHLSKMPEVLPNLYAKLTNLNHQ